MNSEEKEKVPILNLLKSVNFNCGDRRDVLRENSEATIRRLVNAVIEFNHRVVKDFGGREGKIRGKGLIEQVIAATFQTFGGKEIHPGDFDKAAMLFRGIIGGHPFEDGNKRTGFLLAVYFLEQTGHFFPSEDFPINEVEKLCVKVSSGEIRNISKISISLRRLLRKKR